MLQSLCAVNRANISNNMNLSLFLHCEEIKPYRHALVRNLHPSSNRTFQKKKKKNASTLNLTASVGGVNMIGNSLVTNSLLPILRKEKKIHPLISKQAQSTMNLHRHVMGSKVHSGSTVSIQVNIQSYGPSLTGIYRVLGLNQQTKTNKQ